MDIAEIKESVKKIKRVSIDDEQSHIKEDKLYSDFIKHISKTGNDEQRKMARAILRTKKITFGRWCL